MGLDRCGPRAVFDDEACDCRFAVLVSYTQRDGTSRLDVEQDEDVVAEPDVLRSLANVECDLGGALSAVAAVNREDLVFNAEPR